MDAKVVIARRAAKELCDGDVVNLGIGLPTMVAEFLDEDVHIVLQSENGILGMDKVPAPGTENSDLSNAGGSYVTLTPYASVFDSAMSFGVIRGGHVDKAILGALEVDEEGSLASHIIPNKMVPGMGGAMDLVVGAREVIVVTTHTAKGDAPKIFKKCRLPLTAKKAVNWIITELAVIEVTDDGLVLREYNEETTPEHIQSVTEAKLIIPSDIKTFA